MDNNERIALALEKIANQLDFFVELAKKEMDEDEETDETSRPDKITMSFNAYIYLYDNIKECFESYGRVTLGYVIDLINTAMHTTIKVTAKDFRFGWNKIEDMHFQVKDCMMELDITNAKELSYDN